MAGEADDEFVPLELTDAGASETDATRTAAGDRVGAGDRVAAGDDGSESCPLTERLDRAARATWEGDGSVGPWAEWIRGEFVELSFCSQLSNDWSSSPLASSATLPDEAERTGERDIGANQYRGQSSTSNCRVPNTRA